MLPIKKISKIVLLAFLVFVVWSPTSAQEAPPPKKKPASSTSNKSSSKSSTTQTPGKSQTGKSGSSKTGGKSTEGQKTGSNETQPKPKPMGVLETLQSYLNRMSVKVDKPQSSSPNTLVTHYPFDKDNKENKDEIDLVLVYMPAKRMVGFYTYVFGNAGRAKDQLSLFKTLLNLNDRLAVGSFFVDKDQDIGLKFAVRSEGKISFDEFQSVYFAMIAAVKQYRNQVAEFLDAGPAKNGKNNSKTDEDQTATHSSKNPSSDKKPGETRQRRVKQLE